MAISHLVQAAKGIGKGRFLVRRCRVCARTSLFIGLRESDEFWHCIFCRSNRRYELMATVLRTCLPQLPSGATVIEADCRSPLRSLIESARPRINYIRTAYVPEAPFGSVLHEDPFSGALNEDLTALGFADSSADIVIACDVLEHIENLDGALSEVERVLKQGGRFLFTLPQFHVVDEPGQGLRTEVNEQPSYQKARSLDGRVHFMDGAVEYHIDPLSPDGIPVYWSFGSDAMMFIQQRTGLTMKEACPPEGTDRRVVFMATKL